MTPVEHYTMLRDLDVEAARELFVAVAGPPIQEPGKGDPILAGLHKARLRSKAWFTRIELQTSRRWLERNGYQVPE